MKVAILFVFLIGLAVSSSFEDRIAEAKKQYEKDVASMPAYPLNATYFVGRLEQLLETRVRFMGRPCLPQCNINECLNQWIPPVTPETGERAKHEEWSALTHDKKNQEAATKILYTLYENIHSAWEEAHSSIDFPIIRNATHWTVCAKI